LPEREQVSASRDQVLMLRAALLPADDGIAAWRQWRASVDLQQIDTGSSRLLPLLWFNLLELGVEDDWLPRIKGVYRHAWFANQLRMRRLREVEAALHERDIPLVVLKGVALAYSAYPNPGLRPMDDMDLLVRPADVPPAVEALRGAGWSTQIARPARVLQVVHGVEMQRDDDRLDLHGHLFQGSLHTALDQQRWARSELLELPDGPLRVLDPTDQLLHVLVHGVESDPPAPRWLADAMMIMRRDGERIDWGRIAADAQHEGRRLAFARAVDELINVFGAQRVSLPSGSADDLPKRRWTHAERFEHRIAAGPRLPVLGFLVQRIVDWRRWRRADRSRKAGLVGYLRLNWGLASLREMPAQVLRRGLRTLRRDTGALFARLRRSSAATDEPSAR
jgi:hypothetical protein